MSPDPAHERRLRPYSLMIIEDDADLRRLLEILIGRDDRLTLGHSFDNAEAALVAIRDHSPDVILCDVGLPGMSGLEAVPLVRDARPDAAIVMYTANPEGALDAVTLGADAVVSKDTAPTRLCDRVMEIVEQRTSSASTQGTARASRWPAGHAG